MSQYVVLFGENCDGCFAYAYPCDSYNVTTHCVARFSMRYALYMCRFMYLLRCGHVWVLLQCAILLAFAPKVVYIPASSGILTFS